MYKYDIPYPKKDQYALLCSNFPINVSKNISYLRTKMRAHRDECGSEEEVTYSIVTSDLKEVESHTFKKGEKGNSKRPYHLIGEKPHINYKTVYLYRGEDSFTEDRRKNQGYVTSFDVICDEAGIIETDLFLLKLLVDFRWYSDITVMVTNKALVNMATYMPLDKESFINLIGCGERLYAKCGERFIAVIKEYLDAKQV